MYEVHAEISSSGTDEASILLNETRKAVFSNTLRESLHWANTRLLTGGLAERVAALKQESADPIRTIGSLTLARGLIEDGLVDRLRVAVFPIVLGPDGRESMFAEYPRFGLELVDSSVLDSRVVVLEYAPPARLTRAAAPAPAH